ncbi:hypothetical protein H6F45_23765 [Sphaerospermopsis sp. FACHB-1194]|nr:hypothetical protein [Sphaerospermopsis sp. FACHB-1194]
MSACNLSATSPIFMSAFSLTMMVFCGSLECFAVRIGLNTWAVQGDPKRSL